MNNRNKIKRLILEKLLMEALEMDVIVKKMEKHPDALKKIIGAKDADGKVIEKGLDDSVGQSFSSRLCDFFLKEPTDERLEEIEKYFTIYKELRKKNKKFTVLDANNNEISADILNKKQLPKFEDFKTNIIRLGNKYGIIKSEEMDIGSKINVCGKTIKTKDITYPDVNDPQFKEKSKKVVVVIARNEDASRNYGEGLSKKGSEWCTAKPVGSNLFYSYRFGEHGGIGIQTMYYVYFPERFAANNSDNVAVIHFGISKDKEITYTDRRNAESIEDIAYLEKFTELKDVDFDKAFPFVPLSDMERKIRDLDDSLSPEEFAVLDKDTRIMYLNDRAVHINMDIWDMMDNDTRNIWLIRCEDTGMLNGDILNSIINTSAGRRYIKNSKKFAYAFQSMHHARYKTSPDILIAEIKKYNPEYFNNMDSEEVLEIFEFIPENRLDDIVFRSITASFSNQDPVRIPGVEFESIIEKYHTLYSLRDGTVPRLCPLSDKFFEFFKNLTQTHDTRYILAILVHYVSPEKLRECVDFYINGTTPVYSNNLMSILSRFSPDERRNYIQKLVKSGKLTLTYSTIENILSPIESESIEEVTKVVYLLYSLHVERNGTDYEENIRSMFSHLAEYKQDSFIGMVIEDYKLSLNLSIIEMILNCVYHCDNEDTTFKHIEKLAEYVVTNITDHREGYLSYILTFNGGRSWKQGDAVSKIIVKKLLRLDFDNMNWDTFTNILNTELSTDDTVDFLNTYIDYKKSTIESYFIGHLSTITINDRDARYNLAKKIAAYKKTTLSLNDILHLMNILNDSSKSTEILKYIFLQMKDDLDSYLNINIYRKNEYRRTLDWIINKYIPEQDRNDVHAYIDKLIEENPFKPIVEDRHNIYIEHFKHL